MTSVDRLPSSALAVLERVTVDGALAPATAAARTLLDASADPALVAPGRRILAGIDRYIAGTPHARIDAIVLAETPEALAAWRTRSTGQAASVADAARDMDTMDGFFDRERHTIVTLGDSYLVRALLNPPSVADYAGQILRSAPDTPPAALEQAAIGSQLNQRWLGARLLRHEIEHSTSRANGPLEEGLAETLARHPSEEARFLHAIGEPGLLDAPVRAGYESDDGYGRFVAATRTLLAAAGIDVARPDAIDGIRQLTRRGFGPHGMSDRLAQAIAARHRLGAEDTASVVATLRTFVDADVATSGAARDFNAQYATRIAEWAASRSAPGAG